ncbi:hypothetical protein F4556_006256 [Kitasatospora gansuensis]|uniref:Uncharacterized protein n=1 Tax=Kitasatospora gansuensis TaxID=258050 RepID=A0A7W7SHR6_9ACTN|nr:hypothetical protein [Kitasatospora gansuensis]MBB4950721.1 hypothetical protein [Kitasatospora gansuensis]
MAPSIRWAVGHIGAYAPIISPRFDHLVLIVDACDNVALHLAGTPNNPNMPAMRVEECRGYDLWQLRHLTTNAQLYVCERATLPTTADRGKRRPIPRRRSGMADPLTEVELAMLAAVPEISPPMKRLLAGLWVRMSLRDPGGTFHLGGWFNDPLYRKPGRAHWASDCRLWGYHGRWDLEWRGYPFPDDLVAALTHPVAGITGATATRTSARSWVIRLAEAELHLHDREL